MSIAKNTKEIYLEEIIDNLSGNNRELSTDAIPRTREEVLLAEIERLLRDNQSSESGPPCDFDDSNYYNKDDINGMFDEVNESIGEVGRILDDINGEVI